MDGVVSKGRMVSSWTWEDLDTQRQARSVQRGGGERRAEPDGWCWADEPGDRIPASPAQGENLAKQVKKYSPLIPAEGIQLAMRSPGWLGAEAWQ